jgi:hypothetical protein
MPSSKPILGVNDLQSQFPEIAGEAYGWDPGAPYALNMVLIHQRMLGSI